MTAVDPRSRIFARMAPLYCVPGIQHPHEVDQEDDWGCVRAAVASILGLTYDQTPELNPLELARVQYEEGWREWAAQYSIEPHFRSDLAPSHLPIWVAGVRCQCAGRIHETHGRRRCGHCHALAMREDRVFHNPATRDESARPAETVRDVELENSIAFCLAGAAWALAPAPGETPIPLTAHLEVPDA